jgi:hypothetical protein
MLQKTYTKSPCALDRIIFDIQQSTFPHALDMTATSLLGDQLTIGFKTEPNDWGYIDNLVVTHSGQPLPNNVVNTVQLQQLPEPEPFAKPTYRTKRNATASLINVAPGESQTIDYILPAERYVSGGALIVKNAQLGDYITASVYDGYMGGVIPVPYRASLAEAWPVVGLYIEKEWVTVSGNLISRHTIDTYPLNAKISAGLMLRVTYHACAEGEARTVAINYTLTKKL